MKPPFRFWRSPTWCFGMLAVGLAGACSTDAQCNGPAGLCLEVPNASGDGSSGAPSEGGTALATEPVAGNPGAGRAASGPSEAGAPQIFGGNTAGTGGVGQVPGAGTGSGGTAIDGLGQGGAAPSGGTGTGGTVPAGGRLPTGGPDGPVCFTLPPLPLAVSAFFQPQYYWGAPNSGPAEPPGAGGAPPGNEVGQHAPSLFGCPARSPSADGLCFGFEWALRAGEQASVAWEAYACKDPVPSQVTFLARGNVGGEVASFVALGVQLDPQVLTQQWQRFSIDVSARSWPPGTPIVDMFHVSVSAGTDAETPRIFVDDIRWVPSGHCAPPLDLPATCANDAPSTATCDASAGGAAGASATNQELLLLDDFEDGDELSAALAEGRGRWTTYNDQSEVSYQFPEPCPKPSSVVGPDAQSKLSLLTYGCGFNHWGAGVKLTLHDDADACAEPLDASGYDGIQFWAQGSVRRIILQLDTVETTPDACTAAGLPVGCSALAHEVFLERDWTLQRVPFSQLGYSGSSPIRSINWRFQPDAKNQSYSFAIDNVALYRSNGNVNP